jgi:magnesium chelatase family protein
LRFLKTLTYYRRSTHFGKFHFDQKVNLLKLILSMNHQPRQGLAHLFSKLSIDYPMNPCPCGYYGDSLKSSTCAPIVVTKYQKRISGPLLDRIDIHIEVPRVDYAQLSGKRVQAAQGIQHTRFANSQSTDIVSNADMRIGEIHQFCQLQDEGQSLMRTAMSQLQLYARVSSHPEIIATHAYLAGSEEIQSVHLAEALQYRPKIMMG